MGGICVERIAQHWQMLIKKVWMIFYFGTGQITTYCKCMQFYGKQFNNISRIIWVMDSTRLERNLVVPSAHLSQCSFLPFKLGNIFLRLTQGNKSDIWKYERAPNMYVCIYPHSPEAETRNTSIAFRRVWCRGLSLSGLLFAYGEHHRFSFMFFLCLALLCHTSATANSCIWCIYRIIIRVSMIFRAIPYTREASDSEPCGI